jgi:hypothetical protein
MESKKWRRKVAKKMDGKVHQIQTHLASPMSSSHVSKQKQDHFSSNYREFKPMFQRRSLRSQLLGMSAAKWPSLLMTSLMMRTRLWLLQKSYFSQIVE